MTMAAAGAAKGGRTSIEVDGKRVPLDAEGIKKAGGKKVAEAVAAAIKQGIDSE
jgi:hypothetical protein